MLYGGTYLSRGLGGPAFPRQSMAELRGGLGLHWTPRVANMPVLVRDITQPPSVKSHPRDCKHSNRAFVTHVDVQMIGVGEFRRRLKPCAIPLLGVQLRCVINITRTLAKSAARRLASTPPNRQLCFFDFFDRR